MPTINSKKELEFYLMADRMMNRGSFNRTIKEVILNIFFTDRIMAFLRSMRKYAYYKHRNKVAALYWRLRFRKWSHNLGFSIDCESLGYGVVIPHYGTIVVGRNEIGNYAVLHTSITISSNDKIIGDALYVGTGAKLTSKVILGNNVSIGANSVVNKSVPEGNCLLVAAPAVVKKQEVEWYVRDGEYYHNLVKKTELLKSQMGL